MWHTIELKPGQKSPLLVFPRGKLGKVFWSVALAALFFLLLWQVKN